MKCYGGELTDGVRGSITKIGTEWHDDTCPYCHSENIECADEWYYEASQYAYALWRCFDCTVAWYFSIDGVIVDEVL